MVDRQRHTHDLQFKTLDCCLGLQSWYWSQSMKKILKKTLNKLSRINWDIRRITYLEIWTWIYVTITLSLLFSLFFKINILFKWASHSEDSFRIGQKRLFSKNSFIIPLSSLWAIGRRMSIASNSLIAKVSANIWQLLWLKSIQYIYKIEYKPTQLFLSDITCLVTGLGCLIFGSPWSNFKMVAKNNIGSSTESDLSSCKIYDKDHADYCNHF